MRSANRGIYEKEASLGNLEQLGRQVIHDFLFMRMSDYLDAKDLVTLCAVSFAFRDLYRQEIANTLLKLIIDVNHLSKNVLEKLELIIKIYEANPDLMFIPARANEFHVSPCEYIFTHPDVYLQAEFLRIADKNNMLELYVEQS